MRKYGDLIRTDLWRDRDGAEGARLYLYKAVISQAKGQSLLIHVA